MKEERREGSKEWWRRKGKKVDKGRKDSRRKERKREGGEECRRKREMESR